MLNQDPSGVAGPRKPLPDVVSILSPKEETIPTAPYSVDMNQ